MAADTASVGSAVPCPDPSAHQHGQSGHDLSNAASTAALYATGQNKHGESKEGAQQKSVLDANGKLSSSSAAASLKYAKAQDLPSFPSAGIAAGSASKAALLAKDYKMQELWHPELSAAGSKAALLAQQKGGKLDLWEASASKDGHSAATLAMRNKGLGPEIYQGSSAENKSKALLAATMSVNQGRQRAGSSPAPVAPAYPDSHNSAANALSAATASHRTSTLKGDGWNSTSNQAARIVNSKTDRGMYTSDIHFESEDDRHRASLKASAMTMAKQLYQTQNRDAMLADPDGGAGEGAGLAMSRNQASTSTQPDIKLEAMRYIHLQEAAHKLAAERLAKIDKDAEPARFREYYGYGGSSEEKPKRISRMSMRSSNAGRSGGRKRASSDATSDTFDSDDEDQANRIRTQMSQLHTGITTVDAKKQQDDRARVMAAAEKRVSARLHSMDEQVYADTGRVSHSMQEEWEAKARQRAEKEREERASHPGKTHIGGGKFMDQAEIEAIAAARLKPTLDQISDNAEQRRARDEELRIEKQQQEKVKMEETMQKQQQKEEFKKIKDADKAIAQKEKEEARARKEEEKRLAREEKRKSRGEAVVVGSAGTTHAEDDAADAAADNGVERHRSVIARLKNRFRKSGAPGEATTESTSDTTKVTEPTTTDATATPSTPVKSGNAAGAATGATLAEVVHSDGKAKDADGKEIDNGLSRDDTPPPMPISPVTIRETEPKPRASSDVSDNKWKPVSVPTTAAADGIILGGPAIAVEEASDDKAARPPFEQKPSLSGLRSDNAEDSGNHMRELERHISHIPESDDDDEDWNEERQVVGELGDDHAHVVANRVATAPVTDDPAATAAAPLPTSAMTDETLSRLDEQRAAPPTTATTTTTTTTAAAPVVAATTTTAASPSSEEPEKKEKGVRGLLNKLRHKRGDSDTSAPIPATSTKSSTDASAIPEAAGARTIPPVDVGPRFTEADSSDDEDRRGRKGTRGSGKLQKKMGFGNSRTTTSTSTAKPGDKPGEEPGRDSTATATSGDNETFEEARDTFDESLAPPPAFGGQAKAPEGGSPSRGTKFQEEL